MGEVQTNPTETVGLTLRRVEKNGTASYVRSGVRGSLRLNKNMFIGEPPQEISIVVSNLAKPGAASANAKPLTEEDRTKVRAAAEKAKVRAEKAQKRADRLAARAAEFPVEVQPELATTGEETAAETAAVG